jgi:hypothetical protein
MTGTPAVGSTLTCNPGSWQDSGSLSFTYRFVRALGNSSGFTPIPGGDGAQYVVTNDDVGSRVACEEVATNTNTSDAAAARSNAKVAAAGAPLNTEAPAISGSPIVGQTLTCSNGTWANGPLSYSRVWLRGGGEIGGATGTQHVVQSADRGAQLACRVTATNDVGTGPSATSASVFAVAGAPGNVSRPVVTLTTTGPRPTDKEASCSAGSWTDDPGGPYEYVFNHAGAEVVSTDNPYRIQVTDLGRELTCTVTVRNVAGSGSATSAPVLVPLPPIDLKAGPTHMYKAGGYNEFDPVNMLATSDGLQQDLDDAQKARVQAAFDAFVLKCRARTDLEPGLPARDPRVITDPETRNTELCRLVLNTPAEQIVVGYDGVRIVADASRCVLGTSDPCAVLPIPMPAANDVIQAPTINVNTVPERIIWDFNSDGRLDADCPGSAPVARTIFKPGYYNVRAILVMPGSAETGQYPSATLSLSHFPTGTKPFGKLVTYSPGGIASRTALVAAAHVSSVATEIPSGGAGGSLELGTTRKAQPYACRTALEPPPEPTRPCGSDGYMGKVHIEGNLCPISLRRIPQDEVEALKKSDPDVYDILVAQNEALGAAARAARRRGPPTARPAIEFGTSAASAMSISMQQFAAPTPKTFDPATSVRKAFRELAISSMLKAPFVLDQIYISRGPAKVNGVSVTPKTGSIVFVPSDSGEAIESIKKMVVSASNAGVALGGIPLDNGAGPFKQHVEDAQNAAEQVFQKVDLDKIASTLKSKLNLGPFKLAGNANVKLADGVAILEAYAELPSLLTAPGSSPIRVSVTIRGKPDGTVKLDGVRLKAGQAYLGAVKVKDLDLLYDGGLTVKGKLLFPPVDAGVDIQEFRIDDRGNFKALVLAYLAGAGTGIPVGPGVFLTKIGGGLSLDPDEIRASAAVSVGPSAGGGCPTVGADGDLVLHFGPPPFYISTNVDLKIVCLALAKVQFFARQDGYVTLGATMGFDAGPLYFSAGVKGAILLPNWQIEGFGSGGIRKVLQGDVHVIVSNRGFAGCGSIDLDFLGSISGGAGVRYNPTLLLGPQAILANLRLFTGCDLSSYSTVVAAPAAHASAPAGSRSITVERGERSLVLAVDGAESAPKVALRGPDGTVVDLLAGSDSVRAKTALGARSDDERRSFFIVAKPAAGRWTIEPGDGSTAIVRVQRAEVLAKPKISVRVRGKGPRRVMSWKIARQAGQVVRFVEQADGGAQTLFGVRGGGHGTKRFVVSEARGTKRTIVAQVQQDGLPRTNVVVARFSAPSPRVGKPRVRVKRTGKRAIVTWKRTFYAARYDVIVERSTGARTVVSPRGKKRQVVVARLPKAVGLRVRVVGISKSGRRGAAGKAKLAPRKAAQKPRKRGRSRRR